MFENRKEESGTRPAVAASQKQEMFRVLLRSDELTRLADQILSVDDVPDFDVVYALVWETASSYWRKTGKRIPIRALAAELNDRLRDDPEFLSAKQKARLKDLLRSAAQSSDPSDSEVEWASAVFRDYVQDALARQLARLSPSPVETPENLSARVGKIHRKIEEAESLGGVIDVFPQIPEELSTESLERVSTGLGFLDYYMAGGPARREAVGFMAPFGSLKTTLAVNVANRQALYRLARFEAGEGPLELVFYFYYEADGSQEMFLRVMANAARIPVSRLRTKKFSELSTSDALEPYETELFSRQLRSGVPVQGEQERYRFFRDRLNRNLVLCNMTGTVDASGRETAETSNQVGAGGVQEIRSIVQRTLRVRKKAGEEVGVALVVVDYVKAMARRYIQARGLDPDRHNRHVIGGFGLEFKNLVTGPFDCWGLALNQLSGEANQLPPGKVAHHAQAGEAKDWAENFNWAFQVSALDNDGRGVISFTKRRGDRPRPPRVIQLQGEFGLVVDVDDRWAVDPRTSRIIQRSDSLALETPSPARSNGAVFDRVLPRPQFRRVVRED